MFKIILLVMLLFSSVLSNQKEEFDFLGLTISRDTINIKLDDVQTTSIGLRYGKQTLDWRTMFTYSYQKEYQSISAEIDKILMDTLLGTPKIRPYIGFSIGAIKLDYSSLEDTSGYHYGPTAGFIFYTTDSIDIDLSYHYSTVQGMDGTDNIQGITFSVHYFY